jgi:hypothetical protein
VRKKEEGENANRSFSLGSDAKSMTLVNSALGTPLLSLIEVSFKGLNEEPVT